MNRPTLVGEWPPTTRPDGARTTEQGPGSQVLCGQSLERDRRVWPRAEPAPALFSLYLNPGSAWDYYAGSAMCMNLDVSCLVTRKII